MAFLSSRAHDARAQLTYLRNDPTLTLGAIASITDHNGIQTRTTAVSFVPFDYIEIGESVGAVRARFSENNKEHVSVFVPDIECVASRKNEQPFAVSLKFSYLTYLKKSIDNIDNKVFTATFSVLRDIQLSPSVYWYPEFGISKSVGTESDDIKPLFFIASGMTSTVGQQFQFVLVPQIGLQKASTFIGNALGLSLLP